MASPATGTHLIFERYIASRRDMQEVEEAITHHLGGENHRCAFLRSREYIRLRLAALYSSAAFRAGRTERPPTATVAYHNNLSVSLLSDERGALVSVRSVDPPVYPSEFEDEAWDRGVRPRTCRGADGV